VPAPPPASTAPGQAPAAPPQAAPHLLGLAVTPASLNLALGQARNLQVFALYSDGSQVDVTTDPQTKYSAPAGAPFSVSPFGQVLDTAASGGAGTVTVTFQGVSTTVQVNAQALQ